MGHLDPSRPYLEAVTTLLEGQGLVTINFLVALALILFPLLYPVFAFPQRQMTVSWSKNPSISFSFFALWKESLQLRWYAECFNNW